MTIVIPEEIEELIKELVTYEEMEEQDIEWARDWLHINPPTCDPPPCTIEDVEEEETWKIEIPI